MADRPPEWGDLGTVSRGAESEVELTFAVALGIGRWHGVPLVRESPGVERREVDRGRGVRRSSLFRNGRGERGG